MDIRRNEHRRTARADAANFEIATLMAHYGNCSSDFEECVIVDLKRNGKRTDVAYKSLRAVAFINFFDHSC